MGIIKNGARNVSSFVRADSHKLASKAVFALAEEARDHFQRFFIVLPRLFLLVMHPKNESTDSM